MLWMAVRRTICCIFTIDIEEPGFFTVLGRSCDWDGLGDCLCLNGKEGRELAGFRPIDRIARHFLIFRDLAARDQLHHFVMWQGPSTRL